MHCISDWLQSESSQGTYKPSYILCGVRDIS